jgi:glutathione S-transferase
MQLIGMLDSPYVRRVAVALIVAGIPFEHRPISLFRHIDAFSRINPLLKAPTLVTDDGTALIDSTLILEYLAGVYPAVAALTPSAPAERLAALRVTGLGLAVMEKAVQRHYERALRPAEKLHQPWVDRIMGQLHEGLGALDRELPKSGWVGGGLGLADIAAACAHGFTVGMVGDVADIRPYANLAAFSARAEALPAFRAAAAKDGVVAPARV